MTPFEPTLEQKVLRLLESPQDLSAHEGSRKFYSLLPDAKILTGRPDFSAGPLGEPVAIYNLDPLDRAGATSLREVAKQLFAEGLGLAFRMPNSQSVVSISYGSVWSLVQWNQLVQDLPTLDRGVASHRNGLTTTSREIRTNGSQVFSQVQLDDSFLPQSPRTALRNYLRTQFGIQNPAAAKLNFPDEFPNERLAINLPLEFLAQHNILDQAMSGLLWFVPNFYRITFLPRNTEINFEKL